MDDAAIDSFYDRSPCSSDHSADKKHSARPNRDPMSHRIIEKRRRDRMNNCLTNLSKLIPTAYLKKGRGRIEKTEIIEMAIRYMKHMQEDRKLLQPGVGTSQQFTKDKAIETDPLTSSIQQLPNKASPAPFSPEILNERYKQGFNDCIAEMLRFLVAADGLIINQTTKTRLLLHLKDYFGRLTYDTLGPGFVELLQVANTACTSSSGWLKRPGNDLDSSRIAKDDEPLNMSLKRQRLDKSGASGSQLRDILSEAKEISMEPVPRRPQVLRYGPGMEASNGMELICWGGTSQSSGSSQYPSSPGSSRSVSGASSGSFGDSPPRVLSPPLPPPSVQQQFSGIPIFALHPSGLYYVPLTLSSGDTDSGMLHHLSQNYPQTPGPGSCHPVTITVNFCHGNSVSQLLPSAPPSANLIRTGPPSHQPILNPSSGRDGVILAAASSSNL